MLKEMDYILKLTTLKSNSSNIIFYWLNKDKIPKRKGLYLHSDLNFTILIIILHFTVLQTRCPITLLTHFVFTLRKEEE